MFKINSQTQILEVVESTTLKEENILERYDLQKMMVSSWNLVRNDLGLPDAFLVGEEIKTHDSVQNTLDILAFDQNSNSLVVIELKRDKNKLQLLQSLSYAAMINTWDNETLISNIQTKTEESDELREYIKGSNLDYDIKVLLVAEKYDPEVMITADWLATNYGLSVTAYSIDVHKNNSDSFLIFEQRYPLRELSETYESRSRKKKLTNYESDLTWEALLPSFNYPFANIALQSCIRIMPGDPQRRRFIHIFKNIDSFKKITLNFRKKYLNVYTTCNKDEGKVFIINLFGEDLMINEWRDGITFNISTNNEFDTLKTWLCL